MTYAVKHTGCTSDIYCSIIAKYHVLMSDTFRETDAAVWIIGF